MWTVRAAVHCTQVLRNACLIKNGHDLFLLQCIVIFIVSVIWKDAAIFLSVRMLLHFGGKYVSYNTFMALINSTMSSFFVHSEWKNLKIYFGEKIYTSV